MSTSSSTSSSNFNEKPREHRIKIDSEPSKLYPNHANWDQKGGKIQHKLRVYYAWKRQQR